MEPKRHPLFGGFPRNIVILSPRKPIVGSESMPFGVCRTHIVLYDRPPVVFKRSKGGGVGAIFVFAQPPSRRKRVSVIINGMMFTPLQIFSQISYINRIPPAARNQFNFLEKNRFASFIPILQRSIPSGKHNAIWTIFVIRVEHTDNALLPVVTISFLEIYS